MIDHKLLFTQQLVKTTVAEHFIDTGNATPVKIPSPRPIPFHYTERVNKQLEDMAKEGQAIVLGVHQQYMCPRVMGK